MQVNSYDLRAQSPASTLDVRGNLLVIWDDARIGNGDVYSQNINPVGGKVWLADLQVVYPDRFYAGIGTTQLADRGCFVRQYSRG